jgi:hypothetical protein
MRTHTVVITAVLAAVFTAACTTDPQEEPTFEAVMQRVIEPRCTFSSCHALPTKAAKLDLSPARICETLINKPSCMFPDRMRILPGHPEESFFFQKLTGDGLHDPPTSGECAGETNLVMPYGAKALDQGSIDLVHSWIAAGADCTSTGGPIGPEGPTGPVLTGFTVDRAAPLAGESFTFTVTIDQAAPEGGQKVAIAFDTDALSAPLQVTVPATTKTFRFDGLAMAPTSRFTIKATVGESSKELVLRIAGLDIAEVLTDPAGTDEGLQWVKVRNRTAMPIDLSGYELKVGQSNYDLLKVQLTGMLAPGACAVIGGPAQTPENGFPVFAQMVNFTPDLPHSGFQAAGFALFDKAASGVGGIKTPVDTMLVGANNNAQLLGPDAEVASPHCVRPLVGTSALRTGPGTCIEAAMQPNACN